MARFTSLHGVFDLNEFLSGWFLGAPVESILRGNIEEFVSYGFYSKRPEELSAEERRRMQSFLALTEARWGVNYPPGYNPSLKFMSHVWEPLRVHHKPLVSHPTT